MEPETRNGCNGYIGMHVCCSLVQVGLRGPFLYLIEIDRAGWDIGLQGNQIGSRKENFWGSFISRKSNIFNNLL